MRNFISFLVDDVCPFIKGLVIGLYVVIRVNWKLRHKISDLMNKRISKTEFRMYCESWGMYYDNKKERYNENSLKYFIYEGYAEYYRQLSITI